MEMETKINPRLFMTMKKKMTHKMPGKQGGKGLGWGWQLTFRKVFGF